MKYLQLFLNWLRRKPRKESQSDPEKGAITVAETLIALGIGATRSGLSYSPEYQRSQMPATIQRP